MSTNPDSMSDELDRTDELPRLDVAAYEASLARNEKALARTDIWSVSALQEIDDLAEAQDTASVVAGGKASESAALTVNVDGILKRIADLETDVVTAHEANEALQKRSEAIEVDRDRLAARIQTLEAENARQREHRALAQEIAERNELKLKEELRQAHARIDELQSAHAAERTKAEAERIELQRRIAHAAAEKTALAEERRALEGRLQASMHESEQRAELLTTTQGMLGHERVLVAQLTRQLAAKLTDYDKVAALLETRNVMVEDLIHIRDTLEERLRNEVAASVELSRKIAALEQSLGDERTALRERESAIAQKDDAIAAAKAEIGSLRKSLAAAEQRTTDSRRELDMANAARAEHERRSATLAGEIDEARQEIARVQLEIESARAEISNLKQERDAMLPMAGDLATRTAELESKATELAQLEERLASERAAAEARIRALESEREELSAAPAQLAERSAQLETMTAELAQLRERLEAEQATAEARISDLTEQRDALLPLELRLAERAAELELRNRELARVTAELGAAQATLQENAELSEQRSAEMETMRFKVREHSKAIRGLEHAIATRDELAEQLRTQLQSVQDERATVANQLEKARRRVKALTEEVFRRDHRIGELRTELSVHTEALAAIRHDVNRIGSDHAEPSDDVERVLEPLDHDGPSISLEGKMLTVGRTNESDVCIPSKLVSRHHARLLVGPNGVIIEDAGSTNGCYVNGKQVRKHLMQDGDVLELGDVRYRLQTRLAQDTKIRTNVIPIFEPRPNA